MFTRSISKLCRLSISVPRIYVLQFRGRLHENLYAKNKSKEEGEGVKEKREFIKLHEREAIC